MAWWFAEFVNTNIAYDDNEDDNCFIGLTRSEKTSMMTTPNVQELIFGRSCDRSTPPVMQSITGIRKW